MMYRRLLGILIVLAAVWLLPGCSTSSGNIPAPLTKAQLLAQGQTALESVSTNPYMNPTDAAQALGNAATDFDAVLQQDSTNTAAKFGLVLSYTYTGLVQLGQVLPSQLGYQLTQFLTQTRNSNKANPLYVPLSLLASRGRTRSSAVQTAQLQIASSTLSGLTQELPLLSQVQNDVQSGATVQLHMYMGGQIRTVVFGVADIQLVNAFCCFTASLMNLCISYNLDVPNGTAVTPVPVDGNSDGMLEASEYLIAPPFLNVLVNNSSEGPSGVLLYLHNAAAEAQLGSSLTGHTLGNNALIDVTNASVQQEMTSLASYGQLISLATQAQVPIGNVLGDGVSHTLNLPNLLNVSSLRALMPSFPLNDPTAPGVWPDPTFNGIITPGIPQNLITISFQQMQQAY